MRRTCATSSGHGGTDRRSDVATGDNRRRRLRSDGVPDDERDLGVTAVEFRQRVPVDRPLRHSSLVRARHPRQLAGLLRLDATEDASLFWCLPRLAGARRMSLPHHAGHTTAAPFTICTTLCLRKQRGVELFVITSSIVNRFWKFFHY